MNLLRTVPCCFLLLQKLAFAADPPEPKFRGVTIDDHIQIGYGVAVADVDGDGSPDVLLADKKQYVWYRNPGAAAAADGAAWKKFLIAENLTEKDNVCLAAQDLDGDGKCEVAVGAEWNPADTEKSGAVFYLVPPADRTQKWEPVKFPSVEPTTHRMRWIRDGRDSLLLVTPLHGRGNKNGEGAPVKVLAYRKPADVRSEWPAELVDESMHMTHNFLIPAAARGAGECQVLIGGREGLRRAKRDTGVWKSEPVPSIVAPAGIGEIRDGRSLVATVEPMHGNSCVAYYIGSDGLKRTVLSDKLTEGHALACADLVGAGSDQIVVGWRGNPQKPQPVGIKVFTLLDARGEKWRESSIDENEMGCEDLVVADLNADGKPDVVASGRSSHNVKIYLNEAGK